MAIAAVTLMATAGNAAAGEPPPGINWDHTLTAEGVRVYVEEHGDIISVCDAKANGRAAWVQVFVGESAAYEMTVTEGAGSCETRRASDGGKYNLREVSILLFFDGNGGERNWHNFSNNH